jgi:hypothetical protein
MLLLFQKLEHVAHSLGSQVKARYHIDPLIDIDSALPIDQAVAAALKSTGRPMTENPSPLPETYLLEVVRLGMLDLKVARAVHQIRVEHHEPSFPEFIYNRVHGQPSSNLNDYTRPLPDISLQEWRSAWDSLFRRLPITGLDRDIDSAWETLDHLGVAPAGRQQGKVHRTHVMEQMFTDPPGHVPSKRQANSDAVENSSGLSRLGLKKAFDNLGRDCPLREQNNPLDASPATTAAVNIEECMEEDDDTSFDDIVKEAVKTAKPVLSRSIIEFELAMVVMMEVLKKTQLNVMAMHTLDTFPECDGLPSYPERVFNALHSVEPKEFNEHTRILPGVELYLWKRGWSALVQRAMQATGTDIDHNVYSMRARLKQFGFLRNPSTPSERMWRAQYHTEARNIDRAEKLTHFKAARDHPGVPMEEFHDRIPEPDTISNSSTGITGTPVPDVKSYPVYNRTTRSDEVSRATRPKTQQHFNGQNMSLFHIVPMLLFALVMCVCALVIWVPTFLAYHAWQYLHREKQHRDRIIAAKYQSHTSFTASRPQDSMQSAYPDPTK